MSMSKVAKLAGCSHATVSRVINQKPGVSDRKAQMVRRAMRELDYIPPVKRRGPQPKSKNLVRTGNVAVLMFGTEPNQLAAPVCAAAIHAIEDALAIKGYSMTLGQIRDEPRLPSVVARNAVDGLILHGNPPQSKIAERLKRFPVVWMMSPRSERGYWGDRVSPDNLAIGKYAAKYLIDHGHRRLAFLCVDSMHLGFPERLTAFQAMATDAGVACDVVGDEYLPRFSPGDVVGQRVFIDRLIDQLLKLPDLPTGLFVPRGQVVMMVHEALRSRGIDSGRQITLVACDNDPVLAGLSPQIAVIDVRPDRIGLRSVEQLFHRIENPDLFSQTTILVKPTLREPAHDDVDCNHCS